MAAFRVARLGAVTGPSGGGVDAPRRSTRFTTEPATMAVARVPATASRTSERCRRGRAAGADGAGQAGGSGAGSPTHTPKGGGRSGAPPTGDHNRDMYLPPTRRTAQVDGSVRRGVDAAHTETYIVRPGHRKGRPTRPVMARPRSARRSWPPLTAAPAGAVTRAGPPARPPPARLQTGHSHGVGIRSSG